MEEYPLALARKLLNSASDAPVIPYIILTPHKPVYFKNIFKELNRK
jgi:hypothetical protein